MCAKICRYIIIIICWLFLFLNRTQLPFSSAYLLLLLLLCSKHVRLSHHTTRKNEVYLNRIQIS